MNKRYHYLPLSKVKPGMVLADDLLDKVGHVLLPAGATLTERMLQAIGQHDIHQLSIVNDGAPEQDEGADLQAKLQRIELLFRHIGDSEPANLLKTYIIHYRQGEAK